MTIQTRTVAEAEADTRLDRWFRRHFPQLTQGALQKMLRTGQIRIDGKRAEANTRLAAGQEVRIPPLPDGPPPARDQFRRLRRGRRRAAAASCCTATTASSCWTSRMACRCRAAPASPGTSTACWTRCASATRTGRGWCTGWTATPPACCCMARTPGAAAFLAREFRGRGVEKTYWAVVIPKPEQNDGRIDIALLKQDGPRGERVHGDGRPRCGRPRHHRFPHAGCRHAAAPPGWS